MSKNLTRKGLALGSVVALGATLFAGSPALAAPGITLTDLNDKGNYTMLEGEKFTFLASGNADWAGSASTLRVLVKNVSGSANAPTELIGSNGATAESYATSGTTATALGTVAADTAVFAYSTMTSPFQFSLTSGAIAADTTESYEVTAWADVNNNGVINTGEYASPTRTVVFKDIASLTTTITIDSPVQGATTVGADVSIPGVAIDQLTAAEFGVKFTNGTDGSIASSANVDAVTLSTDKTKFESDLAVNALLKDTAVKAQLKWKTSAIDTSDSGNTVVGAAATAAVVAAKAATMTADVVRSKTALYVSTSGSVVTGNVLRNSEFELKATAKDSSTTPKVVAGLAVEVAITVPTGTLSGTAGSVVSLTVNGTTYTDESKLPGASSTYAKIKTTTDADGVAKVKISSAGLTADDVVSAVFSAETLSSTVEVLQKEATYTGYITNYGTKATTTDGVAVPVQVAIVDQFGGVPADGTFDARAIFTSSSQTTAATNASNVTGVAVVAGKATVNILDNGTGTGANVYDIEYIKKDSVNGGYGSNTAVNLDGAFDIAIVSAADAAAGSLKAYTNSGQGTELSKNTAETAYTLDNSSNALSVADFGNFDSRYVLGTLPTQTATAAVIYGKVSSASSATVASAAIAGAPVTLTGTGLLFKFTTAGSKDIYATGSITVPADADGKYEVSVWSQKAGTQTVTITSGSAKAALVEIKFAQPLATAATVLTVDAPAYILPGRTLVVTAKAVDKFGNGVDVADTHASVTYTGPGLVVGSLPTQTDAKGELSFRVLLGANEVGSATVVVKVSADADTTFDETGDLAVTKIVNIGSAPVAGATAAIAGSTKRFFVSVDGNSSAKNVVVKVAGRTFATLKGSSAKKTYTVRAPKGSHKVTVFVGGKLIATKTISVK
jgi:trimeric autotransporter adhesin